jgi:hypothetical protein
MAHDDEHRMDKIFNYLRAKQGVIVGRGYYPGFYTLQDDDDTAVDQQEQHDTATTNTPATTSCTTKPTVIDSCIGRDANQHE